MRPTIPPLSHLGNGAYHSRAMTIQFSQESLLAPMSVLFSQPRQVKFQDVDAAGTIYFARMFEYFSDAYLALLQESQLDVAGMLERREGAAPLVHAEADYLAPLFFGDAVIVEVVRAHLGSSSTRFGYRVKKTDGKVAALGQTHHVWIDRKEFKPRAIPEALREFLLARGATVAAEHGEA